MRSLKLVNPGIKPLFSKKINYDQIIRELVILNSIRFRMSLSPWNKIQSIWCLVVFIFEFFFFSQIFSYCYNLSQYMFKSQNYSLWISRYGKLIFNFYFLLLVLTSDFLSGFTKVKMLSCVLDVLVCETMTKKNYLSHPIEGGIYYIKTSTFRHLDTLVI